MRRLVLLLLTLLILTGCAKAPVAKKASTAAPPVITLWHSYQGASAQGLEKARRELEKSNPALQLQLVYMPADTFSALLTQARAAGKGPDLILVDQLQLQELYISGVIQPIQDYFDSSLFFKSAVQAVSYNGGVLAVPKSLKVPLLAYNKDLVPNPPSAWEQVLDQAGKVTRGAGIGVGGDPSNLFLSSSLYTAFGARFWDTDQKPDLNNPEAQNFLRAVPPKVTGFIDPQVTQGLIAAGATPFALFDSGELGTYKGMGKNLGFSGVPGPGGKEGKGFVRAEGFAVSSKSVFPREAVAVAVYLTSPAAMNLYAPADFEAQIAAYDQKPLKDNAEAQLVKHLATVGVGYPIDSRTTTLLPIVSQMLKDTQAGTDAAAAAQAAQDKAQQALGLAG